MKLNRLPDDIYWEMDWSDFNKSNPNNIKTPEIETIFKENNI